MWRHFLSHRWCIPMLALLGMLLVAPTLGVGLFADDFIHRSLLLGETHAPHSGSLFGLFNFLDGQAERTQALKVSGQLLWWAADAARLSFWRPLSEATHWLDYQLWPDLPVLMHAQNLLWYGLLVVLLGKLYRLLDPSPVPSGLGVLVFALSNLHLSVVSWIAARNQLIAACFLVVTVMAFHLWRSQRSTRHAWLAVATFMLGLMSAEAAVATLGYLAAYSLTMESGQPWLRRLRALLPFLLIAVVWRLVYSHLGFGSMGSGGYIDPGANLPRFGMALLLRLPTLMLAQILSIPSGILNGMDHLSQMQYALAATGLIGLCAAAGHYFKLWASPLTRFYALGSLLALVPVCAAEPSDRLLLNAEIGMSAVVAMLLCQMLARHRLHSGWLSKGAKALVGFMMLLHLLIAPLQTVIYSVMMVRVASPAMVAEPLSLPNVLPGDVQHVILLNPPKPPVVFYYPLVRRYFGMGNAASTQALGSGNQALSVHVISESSIELSGARGFMDSMSRDIVTRPFKVGDKVNMGQIDVTVRSVTAEGVPLAAVFDFRAPLSDPRWRFYEWGELGYKPFAMPPPGHTTVLPAIDVGKMIKQYLKGKRPAAHLPSGE